MTDIQFKDACQAYYDGVSSGMRANTIRNERLLAILPKPKREVVLRAMHAASVSIDAYPFDIERGLPAPAEWDKWYSCWWFEGHCYIKIRKDRYLKFKV